MAQLDLALDRSSDVPLGTQLAWKLRGAVATGALAPGDRLPGVREMAEAAGVNVNTVRAVYARLGEQGLIASEHGRGTFVAPQTEDQAELRGLAERAAGEARRLGLDPRELAVLLYADTPAREGAATRQALRSQIATLERDLTELDAQLGKLGDPPAQPRVRPGTGPRLLGTDELEALRDRLAAQVDERRERVARGRAAERARPEPEPAAAWPELRFGAGTVPA